MSDNKKVKSGITYLAPLYCDPNKEYYVGDNGEIYGKKTGEPLYNCLTNSGYKQTQLKINGERVRVYNHRAVLQSFNPIDNADEMQVNHLDGDKLNNNLYNLIWSSASENILHSLYDLGNISKITGFPKGNQYAVGNQNRVVAVQGFDKDTNYLKYEFKSTAEAGRYFANGDPEAEQRITRRIYKAKESYKSGYNAFYADCYWKNKE